MRRTIILLLTGALLGALLSFAGAATAHDPSECPGDDDWGLPQTTVLTQPQTRADGTVIGGMLNAHGYDVWGARVREIEEKENVYRAVITFSKDWTIIWEP